MEAIIRAEKLVKDFAKVRAVDGIDLAVAPGERVALLGPNGAGKTTTLFMLLGVITPDSGWVEIAGHRMPGERSQALARVGFSAGYLPLAERMRVGEFLTLYGQLQGLARPKDRIEETLDRLGVSHLIGAMSNELSSGQRTLVGIAKALLHHPRALILDEPTASLDPDVALRVRTGLQEYCRDENVALLITSHNMLEIERLCERVIFLSKGQIVANDSPAAVAARFGREDLEGVFLHLAAGGQAVPMDQETDRPA
jgi:ABC-2 type transport system ATP-binding protein